MIELLFLKIYLFTNQNASFTLAVMIAHVINAGVVFATFEFHWLKTNEDEFFHANRPLIRQLDKGTYELFRYVFIVIPLTSVYLWIRLSSQKFSSASFLKDYGVRRRLM